MDKTINIVGWGRCCSGAFKYIKLLKSACVKKGIDKSTITVNSYLTKGKSEALIPNEVKDAIAKDPYAKLISIDGVFYPAKSWESLVDIVVEKMK